MISWAFSLLLWVPPTTTAPIVQEQIALPPKKEEEEKEKKKEPLSLEKGRKVERVAVYELEGAEVPERTRRIVTDAIVVELRKLQGVSVTSMDEVRAMLQHEAERELVGCASDESCLADVADALGVDFLITGSLSSVGEETVLGLRRIDQRTAATTARVTKRVVKTDGSEALAAIGPLVEELYPNRPLLEGQTRGVADAVRLRLNPPPIPAWATASALGAGGLLLVSGGVTGMLTAVTQREVEGLVSAGQSGDVDGRTVTEGIERGKTLALTTNVLIGAGLLVAAGGAAVVPLTDWTNAGAE